MDCDPMLAPCGLECCHCIHFLARKDPEAMKQIQQWSADIGIPSEEMLCGGCRAQAGQIPFQKHLFGKDHRCAIYACSQREVVSIIAGPATDSLVTNATRILQSPNGCPGRSRPFSVSRKSVA